MPHKPARPSGMILLAALLFMNAISGSAIAQKSGNTRLSGKWMLNSVLAKGEDNPIVKDSIDLYIGRKLQHDIQADSIRDAAMIRKKFAVQLRSYIIFDAKGNCRVVAFKDGPENGLSDSITITGTYTDSGHGRISLKMLDPDEPDARPGKTLDLSIISDHRIVISENGKQPMEFIK